MTRLTLLCCGATATARDGGFAAPDEPLDAGGRKSAARFRLTGPRPAAAFTSPATAARQSIAAALPDALVTEALNDMNWGQWAGQSFDSVHASSAERVAEWLADPLGGAPGGERFLDVQRRVGAWFETIGGDAGRVVAVTHPMVIRAILTRAIGIDAEAALRIDIAPLSLTELSFHRIWRLQELRRV